MLKKELNDAQVNFQCVGVHSHGNAAEVHKKGPIHTQHVHISTIREQYLSYSEANRLILKGIAVGVLGQS